VEVSGETLDLVYAEQSKNKLRSEVVEDIVSNLSDAGIEVQPRPVLPGEFFEEVLPDGDFDLALLTTGSPSEYEALLPSLPPNSRETLAQTIVTPDAQERAEMLSRAQREMFGQSALLPLFVWPDTMAWSSTLSGPRPDTPYRGLMSNAREWAFYK
jgi:ABC-type transport system substrate-binding protein